MLTCQSNLQIEMYHLPLLKKVGGENEKKWKEEIQENLIIRENLTFVTVLLKGFPAEAELLLQ